MVVISQSGAHAIALFWAESSDAGPQWWRWEIENHLRIYYG
jgi:hypothetical protein